MSECRQDGISGAWVIIAPERGRRPRAAFRKKDASGPLPAFDVACAFCPGNERLLPSIIEQVPSHVPPGWCVRVVPNKYPLLRPDAGPAPPSGPIGSVLRGEGCHEVIIESPRHDGSLSTMAGPDFAALVDCYHRRFVALTAAPAIRSVVIFRNHGDKAGASLVHPHSQLIATAIAPPRQESAVAWVRSHHPQYGSCATCAQLACELEDGRRIVEATELFVHVVPFAAASPLEQWILPRRHEASFAHCGEAGRRALGTLLQRALRRLRSVLDDPPYNYIIETALPGDSDPAARHWRLRIVPGLGTAGGFEIGTGIAVNPSLPEDDAAALRAAPAGES